MYKNVYFTNMCVFTYAYFTWNMLHGYIIYMSIGVKNFVIGGWLSSYSCTACTSVVSSVESSPCFFSSSVVVGHHIVLVKSCLVSCGCFYVSLWLLVHMWFDHTPYTQPVVLCGVLNYPTKPPMTKHTSSLLILVCCP